MSSFVDQIEWNSDGLVPVVTQDVTSGSILMHAWANKEALQVSISEGRAVYWSRSRSGLWRKGEKSGNTQKLVDVYLDVVFFPRNQLEGFCNIFIGLNRFL